MQHQTFYFEKPGKENTVETLQAKTGVTLRH